MSFGFSPSDFVTLIHLTRKAYKGWKSACGDYSDITSTLFSLQVVLKRVHRHVEQPGTENGGSFLQDPGTLRDDLAEVLRNSNRTIGELRAILQKYPSLGRNRKSNWERLRLGCQQLDGLQIRLSRDLNLISTLLLDRVLLSIETCRQDVHHISRKIQGGVPVALENIVESQASDARTASTAFTTHEHDSIEVWRGLRREMVNLGFKSDDVLANKDDLLALARAITGNYTQQVQEQNTTAANPPLAPPTVCPNEGELDAGIESQRQCGATGPSSSGPSGPPGQTSNTSVSESEHVISSTGRTSQEEELQQPLSELGSTEGRPNRTTLPDQPTNQDTLSGPSRPDGRNGFLPSQYPALYNANPSSNPSSQVPTDRPSISHESPPSIPMQPTLPLLDYEPMLLEEQSRMHIHLCLPRGWQIHIDRSLKVTFKDLYATKVEPVYLELPPRVHSELVPTPAGWKMHSSRGRLSWSPTDDEWRNSVRYTHPAETNEKPRYRLIQEDWGRPIQEPSHSLKPEIDCYRFNNGFFVANLTSEKRCQVLAWTHELDSANPRLVQCLRQWVTLSSASNHLYYNS